MVNKQRGFRTDVDYAMDVAVVGIHIDNHILERKDVKIYYRAILNLGKDIGTYAQQLEKTISPWPPGAFCILDYAVTKTFKDKSFKTVRDIADKLTEVSNGLMNLGMLNLESLTTENQEELREFCANLSLSLCANYTPRRHGLVA